MEELKIDFITDNDKQAAVEHLRNNFCKDEPLLNYVKLKDFTELDNVFLDVMKEGISFKAADQSGKIVGVYLNKFVEKNKQTDSHEHPPMSPEFQIVSTILDHADELVDIFGLYPDISAYIDASILSVDSSCRGKGVAKKLTEALFDLAKTKNVHLIRVFCSSFFTYQICTKFGFKKIAEKPYSDMDLGSVPSVKIPEPHSSGYIVVKEL